MESYSLLLEKTRVPQQSLQKLAVHSIFSKLRTSPPHSGPDSDPGRHAITQCLQSTSPAVIDQSVRELCLLVKDSKLDLPRGLLELQSSLEGSNSRYVDVFVKGLGFLVRLGFQRNTSEFRFHSSETHPFVKILSCRSEVSAELVQQVLIFIVQNKQLGILEVCEFLRPFLNFVIIRMPLSVTLASFARNLISSTASVCGSFPREAMTVIKLLMGCLRYLQCKNAEDFANINYFMEYIVEAFLVVLRNLVRMRLLVREARLCGVELMETIFSLHMDLQKLSGGSEAIFELSRRLLVVQKELGLSYIPEFSSVILSLFVIFIHLELEHEQLSILKLLLLLLVWKSENEYVVGRAASALNEELLFIFPVINLMSSPSKSVKQAVTDLLFVLEKLSINLLIAPKRELTMQGGFPSISRPGYIIFRLLQHLWYQV